MAKLPDLNAQERPIPQPGTGLAQYRSDFGGQEQAGQMLARTGSEIERAGNEVFHAAKVEQEKIDTLKAEDAFTKLRARQLDLTMGDKEGFDRLKGAAAVNTPILKDWGKKFQDSATDIESGLQTEDQKLKFRQRAQIAGLQFQESILRHTAKESDVYAKEVFDGTVAIETRQATASWQEPAQIGLSIERINNAVTAQGQRNGWPAELTEAARLKADGAVHQAVIQQALASGNYQYAQAWYNKNKADIDLPTAKALETAVKDGTQKQLAADYTGDYLANRDNSEALGILADRVLADQKLDDTRKNTIRSSILSRIDRLDKQQQTRTTIADKEIERGIAKVNSITLSGFEPTMEQVQPLIAMAQGTRYEAEVKDMVNTMVLTQNFRKMPPPQQEAEITRMTLAARAGGAIEPRIKFSAAVEAHGPVIDTAAQKYGIDATVMRAQIAQESGGNPKAVSDKGARGVAQFIPGTAARYGVDVNDPASSIDGQARYMKDLLNQFGGDYRKALAAYNMGEGGPGNKDGVYALVQKWGDDWLSHAPNQTKDYVASITKMAGGARAMSFDVTMLKRFEAIQEAQAKDIKTDFVTYAVRQQLIASDDPGAQPLDMSQPAKLDPEALKQRIALAQAGVTQFGAPFKPLSVAETNLAVATLKISNIEEKKTYFRDLLQAASNNAGTVVSGMRDDQGGIRSYKAIMGQIAPDSPVLAHAGVAAARGQKDPKQGDVADLILQGYQIMNPDRKTDGKPDGPGLRNMPPESKMRLDFDNAVRDAFAGNDEARNGYYQTAKSIYAALSSKSNDADTTKLDSERWKDSIRMAAGEIIDYKGKYTPLPWGVTPGDFKDGVASRIDSLILGRRLNESMTPAKLKDMKLEAAGDGVYVFREGDKVLVDRFGKAVTIDFNRPVPWGAPNAGGSAIQPTAAELAEAGRPYTGRGRRSGEQPIDMSRPRIENPDGSFSTERTITVEADGKHFLIPTIVGGKQLSEDAAVKAWRDGKNKAVGEFDTAAEAERQAKSRSRRIGDLRGNK